MSMGKRTFITIACSSISELETNVILLFFFAFSFVLAFALAFAFARGWGGNRAKMTAQAFRQGLFVFAQSFSLQIPFHAGKQTLIVRFIRIQSVVEGKVLLKKGASPQLL